MPLFHFRETCFTFYRHSATADRQRRQRETNRGWSTPPLISGGGGRAGLKFADGIISRWTITARRKTFENSEFRASSFQRRRHASSRNESVYQLARKYEVRKRIIRVRDASSKLPPPSSSGIDERQHHPSSYGASGVTTERGKNILLRKGGWNTTLSPLSFSIIDGVERELQENSVTYTQLVLRLPRAHNSRGEARPVVHRTKVESWIRTFRTESLPG